MQRDGSIGPDNMGSDPDHNRSHFNGVMEIKAEFKYVEGSLGGTKKKTVNPIATFEFCCERVGRARAVAWGQGKGPPFGCFLCEMCATFRRISLACVLLPSLGKRVDHSILYANENEQRK